MSQTTHWGSKTAENLIFGRKLMLLGNFFDFLKQYSFVGMRKWKSVFFYTNTFTNPDYNQIFETPARPGRPGFEFLNFFTTIFCPIFWKFFIFFLKYIFQQTSKLTKNVLKKHFSKKSGNFRKKIWIFFSTELPGRAGRRIFNSGSVRCKSDKFMWFSIFRILSPSSHC